jgi:hypothetical protein
VLRGALAHTKRLEHLDVEIFVQGSYANDTNVRKDSDVDLVVQLKLPFEEDVRRLTPPEVGLFYQRYGETDYGWEEFREDVVASLRESFFVNEGNKCIDITDMDSLLRVPADVLPAIEFRRYLAFPSLAGEVYEEGVFFRDSSGHVIVNFPKQHLANGRAKNRATGGRFKQVVRVAKNARKHETAGLEKDAAPSYFLECLLFNVPDDCFRADLDRAYHECLDWLLAHRGEFGSFKCQNRLVKLFGNGRDQWSTASGEALLVALTNQWDTWSA